MKKKNKMVAGRSTTSLYASPVGEWVKIVSLPAGNIRAQFIRLGVGEGERILCLQRLPGGTIVLQKKRQQIAVGHQLSRQIMVTVICDQEATHE
jgi:Fe2+ transport system protein FeoA